MILMLELLCSLRPRLPDDMSEQGKYDELNNEDNHEDM